MSWQEDGWYGMHITFSRLASPVHETTLTLDWLHLYMKQHCHSTGFTCTWNNTDTRLASPVHETTLILDWFHLYMKQHWHSTGFTCTWNNTDTRLASPVHETTLMLDWLHLYMKQHWHSTGFTSNSLLHSSYLILMHCFSYLFEYAVFEYTFRVYSSLTPSLSL
jgi:hypothetical protein